MKIVYSYLFFFLFISFSFSQEIKKSIYDYPPPYAPDFDERNIIYGINKVDEVAIFTSKDNKDLLEYIKPYLLCTENALDDVAIERKIDVRLVIERDGSITNVQTVQKIGNGLDEIAVNAVKKTDKMWIPAQKNGKAVRSVIRIPIVF